jgi:hypothetical protein
MAKQNGNIGYNGSSEIQQFVVQFIQTKLMMEGEKRLIMVRFRLNS